MGVERDVAHQHDVRVALDLLEDALEQLLGIDRRSRRTAARRPWRPGPGVSSRPSRVGSSPAQRSSVRTAASASARLGRPVSIPSGTRVAEAGSGATSTGRPSSTGRLSLRMPFSPCPSSTVPVETLAVALIGQGFERGIHGISGPRDAGLHRGAVGLGIHRRIASGVRGKIPGSKRFQAGAPGWTCSRGNHLGRGRDPGRRPASSRSGRRGAYIIVRGATRNARTARQIPMGYAAPGRGPDARRHLQPPYPRTRRRHPPARPAGASGCQRHRPFPPVRLDRDGRPRARARMAGWPTSPRRSGPARWGRRPRR